MDRSLAIVVECWYFVGVRGGFLRGFSDCFGLGFVYFLTAWFEPFALLLYVDFALALW